MEFHISKVELQIPRATLEFHASAMENSLGFASNRTNQPDHLTTTDPTDQTESTNPTNPDHIQMTTDSVTELPPSR